MKNIWNFWHFVLCAVQQQQKIDISTKSKFGLKVELLATQRQLDVCFQIAKVGNFMT